jgi:hypothetical protein
MYYYKPYGGPFFSVKDTSKETLEVRVFAKEGNPSRRFITNPEIREALRKTNFSQKEEFGHIKFTYHKNTKTLEYTLFFPLPVIPKTTAKDRSAPVKAFAKKGIASFIETRALKYALTKFPEATKISVHLAKASMRRRIRLLGFHHAKKTELEEFKSKLRERTAANILKARAKKKILSKLKNLRPRF